MLLKSELDYVFKHFGSNFNSIGKKFLTNLAKVANLANLAKKKIDYNNLFFEINDDKFVIKTVDFVEEIDTFCRKNP